MVRLHIPWGCIIWLIEPTLWFKFYHICKWGTKLKVCFKLCTIIFLKALKGIWNLQNQQSFWKQRGPRFWRMWKPVGYLCCPLPDVLWQNTKYSWWRWPLMILPMKRQRQILIFFVMCNFYWGLLPFSYCCSLFITWSNLVNCGMFSFVILWQ